MKVGAAPCLFLLSTAGWSQTDAGSAGAAAGQGSPTAEAPADVATEKVLVVGKRRGPGLWKVSKGEHVLWVFEGFPTAYAAHHWPKVH